MRRKFISALDRFEGAFFTASTAHLQSGPDDSTPEEQYEWCLKKFGELRVVWNRDSTELQEFEKLVLDCVDAYAKNDIDRADSLGMGVQKKIWDMRLGEENKITKKV